MSGSLRGAMRLLERGVLDDAARALAPLASASREGVVARIRLAEALSRLGRHDEAVTESETAVRDAPGQAAPAVWHARCLAEAGRWDEVAATTLPATSVESLDFLKSAFGAVARIAAGDRTDPTGDARLICATHHSPLYSLALRAVETRRLGPPVRSPDLVSCSAREDCREWLEEEKKPHPQPPPASDVRAVTGFLNEHAACADHGTLVAAVESHVSKSPELAESAFEVDLASGRTEAAFERIERIAESVGDEASPEVAIDRVRARLLLGRPARVDEFPGGDRARRTHPACVLWLETADALLRGDGTSARASADRCTGDVSQPLFVGAALGWWVHDGA